MDKPTPPDDYKRFELGMEILARLERESWTVDNSNPFENFSESDLPGYAEGQDYSQQPSSRPTLRSILADLAPLSQQSLLIGSCEDGLPVLLDLGRTQSGSLLILGCVDSGKTALLKSILTSASLINTPRKVRYVCISSRLAEYSSILSEPHCYRSSHPYEIAALEIVGELAELVSQRKMGKGLGPAILLAIDNLDEFIGNLYEEDIQRLLWLIKEGPASQVWTLATLDASRLDSNNSSLPGLFKTWLIGQIDPSQQPFLSDRIQEARPEDLIPGAQFCTLYNDEWVRFWIPS
jgi:hypothetical protein